jgi:hypothetical protein
MADRAELAHAARNGGKFADSTLHKVSNHHDCFD